MAAGACGLPAGWYRDPAHHAREAETIFARNWLFVCHVSDLPSPGTAARFDCAGRSLFVLRTGAGELRAFRNACAHRGMRLIEGDAHTGLAFCLDARVRCPWHGWTYDDAGVCIDAGTGCAGTDARRGAAALRPASVEAWRGLVFAAFDAPATSLATLLAPVAEGWQDATALRRIGDPLQRPLAADWKLACEHLLDVACRAQPARSAWQVFGAPRLVAVDGTGALAGIAELAVPDTAAWPARTYRRLVGALQAAPAREHWLFAWPNLLLTHAPDGLRVRQAIPTGAGTCLLREVRYGAADSSRAMRLLRYASERTARRSRQDAATVLERAQRGRAALDADEALPVEADSEPGLAWFTGRNQSAQARPVAAGDAPARKARRRRAAPAPA